MHIPDFFTEKHLREANVNPSSCLPRIAKIWNWRGRNTLYPDTLRDIEDLCEFGAERLMRRVRSLGPAHIQKMAKVLRHFHFMLRP